MQNKNSITNCAPNIDDEYSLFLISSTSLALSILMLVLYSDMLAGPLRYYLSRIGMDAIAYLPKVASLFFVVFEIYRNRICKPLFYIALLLAVFSIIGLINQCSILSIGFSLFLISPFLFGISVTRYVDVNERLFIIILSSVFIVTAFGVFLDFFVNFPWSGFTYNVGGTEIEGTREWTTKGLERCAGFARMSTSAAFYLVGSSLLLFKYEKDLWLKFLILLIAFPAILLTTSKAGILGFVLGISSILITKHANILILKLFVFFLVSIILYFPISTLILNYKIDLTDPISLLLFASFEDRLLSTWPNFFSGVAKFGNSITGVGFGGVGSAIKYFARGSRDSLQVADNFPLYLYGCFGVLAVVLVIYLVKITLKLFASQNRLNIALAVVMVAMLTASLTTDIIEAQAYAIMLGIAIAKSAQLTSYENIT